MPSSIPRLKEFDDPITGERLLAIPAIDIDVALIHAGAADPYGNVQHVGTGFGDRAHHRAADKTIVTVDKVIPNEEVRANPYRTSIAGVDAVVRAPYGSHPYASPGHYLEDAVHIREYVGAATARLKDGNRAPLDDYLRKYVLEPATHARISDADRVRAHPFALRSLGGGPALIAGRDRLHHQGIDGGLRRRRDQG